jgi:hypothetical protein
VGTDESAFSAIKPIGSYFTRPWERRPYALSLCLARRRPKEKSTSRRAQNAAKSLIGEAWMKCCSTIPTISTDRTFSIPDRQGCKMCFRASCRAAKPPSSSAAREGNTSLPSSLVAKLHRHNLSPYALVEVLRGKAQKPMPNQT